MNTLKDTLNDKPTRTVKNKKRWQDLPVAARVAIVVLGSIEISLFVAAQVDITHRPAEQIRGGKLRWRLISLINILGPLAYFKRGRIPAASEA